jgi:tRNA(Arg) A34 adenosine deaminase TadA
MKDILKLGVTLFAICAVAALVLGVTNNITAPVIEERNIQASNKARKIVLPEADDFKKLDGMNSDMILEVYEGIKDGKVIAKAHNLKERLKSPCAHAEILAINEACRKIDNWRLTGAEMYVTLEPCTMCAAAISFARIKNLYFGAYDEKGGAVVNGIKFYEQKTCHHKPNVVGGILENECAQILKDFFKNKRIKD